MPAVAIRVEKGSTQLESETSNADEEQNFSLPLPLAPFEAYMLADHRDDYPMHFYCRLVLQGSLHREILVQSLTESVERHPLLRAKIRPRFGRSPVWDSGAEICLRDCQHEFDDLSEVLRTPGIDLCTEAGLRTWLFQGASNVQLLFEFHHSCCDGLGALMFLEDVLVTYDKLVHGKNAEDEVVQDTGLSSRAAIPLTVGQAVRKIPLDVKDFFRILFRQPAIVSEASKSPGISEKDGNSQLSAFLNHQFSPAELNALLAAARSRSTTLNSILMRDVYRSLDQWMCQCGDLTHRWIRMGVPASTRADGKAVNTCCNQVTIMFLDQHSSDIRNSDSLLDQVTQLTRFHRESNIWYSMLQLLDFLAVFPPLLRLYLRTNRRMCTTILSNLGRAFELCPLSRKEGQLIVGNMQLTSLDFFSPLRPGTDVTFAVVTYAGSLSLCMHYKPNRIAEAQARELFDRLVRNVRESTELEPTAT